MHNTSKSVKLAAGALAIAWAVFGLTACGHKGGGLKQQLMNAPSPISGSSSAQYEAPGTLK
jgi:hypothetical protein